ncbi:MAG: SPOR domain-containing protein [Saprospiraceae bacterium]|nr:SPOR domain-containing protein [Saprospiraceae bacterium]MDW8483350.1 SPOR domain-containing protein [Saprospiraceae bacterium]
MYFFLRYGLLLCLLAAVCEGLAQRVEINVDPAVEQLVRTWTAQNRSNPRTEGWRVQIASSTDRQRIENARIQFLALYPDVPVDWVHERPYYKLRVGAFRTRQEAMAFLMQVRHVYPDAYPTRDPNIHPRDFIR